MAMIAACQSRLCAGSIRPAIVYDAPELYGGPEFFREQFEKNDEKKDENNSPKIDNKKFYKNPKIMVPVGIGGATVLTGITLLSLWWAGIIGKEDKKEDKKEKKVPFDDYLKLVEKIKSGEVFDYCSGLANYNYTDKTFSPSFNGIDDNNESKSEICKKLDARLLTEFASSFVEIKNGNKWRLSTDNDSTVGKVEVTIFFNSVKKRYEIKLLDAISNSAHKYNIKLDDMEKK